MANNSVDKLFPFVQHLLESDSDFRKKVITMAAEQGLALYNAAMDCASEDERPQIKQVVDIRENRKGSRKSGARKSGARKINGLTKREQEVYVLLHEHKNLKKVCKLMKLNERAVRYHMRHAQDKTGEDLFALVGKNRIHRASPKRKKAEPKKKGSKKESRFHGGSREKSVARNNKLRNGILSALGQGPGTAMEIRERMPKKTRDMILSPFMLGNAMTTLRAANKIRRKGNTKGNKTVWQLK
jgi:hypothetical protein